MLYALDLAGIVVFAISGALVAGRKRMDFFGVVVLAVVTAVGGGTLRDLLLGTRPVFWVADPTSILVAVAAAAGTVAGARLLQRTMTLLLVADAFGLALFTVLGTEKALAYGAPPVIAVMLGMMSGTAGGMVRDVLCGEIPLILRKEIYATAALLSGVSFVLLSRFGAGELPAVFGAVVPGLALRLAAIRWQLSLPVFDTAQRR